MRQKGDDKMKTAAEGWQEEQAKMSTPLTKCASCGLEEKQQSRAYQATINLEVEASNIQLADELVGTILSQLQAQKRIGSFYYLQPKQLNHPSPIPRLR